MACLLLLHPQKITDAMGAYQQKWLEILRGADLPGWDVKAVDDSIYVEMPRATNLKLTRDILPETLAALSLDINVTRSRLKFHFYNGHEKFDYVLNAE